MDSTEALRCDLEEFEAFLKLAKRPSVKSFLSAHCQRLRNQIEEAERLDKCASQVTPTVEVFNTIDRFAWDQTRDLVKVYVQLDGLGSLPEEATSVHFEETSAQLVVQNLRHKNYILKLCPLYGPIDVGKSSFSRKRDTATLRLAKAWERCIECYDVQSHPSKHE